MPKSKIARAFLGGERGICFAVETRSSPVTQGLGLISMRRVTWVKRFGCYYYKNGPPIFRRAVIYYRYNTLLSQRFYPEVTLILGCILTVPHGIVLHR
jgi:hypothetical protein